MHTSDKEGEEKVRRETIKEVNDRHLRGKKG